MTNGDIVYFTKHYSEWVKSLHSDLEVSLEQRIAKIIKIFDWDTDEGKLLLSERKKNGKWKNLKSEDFKFVLKVYYPELSAKNSDKRGLIIPEVLPQFYPGTDFPLFEVFPEELLEDLKKPIEEDVFKLKRKDA